MCSARTRTASNTRIRFRSPRGTGSGRDPRRAHPCLGGLRGRRGPSGGSRAGAGSGRPDAGGKELGRAEVFRGIGEVRAERRQEAGSTRPWRRSSRSAPHPSGRKRGVSLSVRRDDRARHPPETGPGDAPRCDRRCPDRRAMLPSVLSSAGGSVDPFSPRRALRGRRRELRRSRCADRLRGPVRGRCGSRAGRGAFRRGVAARTRGRPHRLDVGRRVDRFGPRRSGHAADGDRNGRGDPRHRAGSHERPRVVGSRLPEPASWPTGERVVRTDLAPNRYHRIHPEGQP